MKQSEELEVEIESAETRFNSINEELKSLQEKFAVLRENKARFEATVEGIDQRKMDLIYQIQRTFCFVVRYIKVLGLLTISGNLKLILLVTI